MKKRIKKNLSMTLSDTTIDYGKDGLKVIGGIVVWESIKKVYSLSRLYMLTRGKE